MEVVAEEEGRTGRRWSWPLGGREGGRELAIYEKGYISNGGGRGGGGGGADCRGEGVV